MSKEQKKPNSYPKKDVVETKTRVAEQCDECLAMLQAGIRVKSQRLRELLAAREWIEGAQTEAFVWSYRDEEGARGIRGGHHNKYMQSMEIGGAYAEGATCVANAVMAGMAQKRRSSVTTPIDILMGFARELGIGVYTSQDATICLIRRHLEYLLPKIFGYMVTPLEWRS